MPVASPKIIRRASTSKKPKENPDEYYSPDVMSENMYGLLEFLRGRGDVGPVYTQHYSGAPELAVGDMRIADKSIAIIAGSPEYGNKTLAHEITHALNRRSNLSRDAKIEAYLSGRLIPWDLTFPTSYHEGKVAAPLIGRTMAGNSFAGYDENFFTNTAKQRTKTVRTSIPEEHRSWSGLTPVRGGEEYTHRLNDEEEGQAYYLTDPKVATPQSSRAKEFGMFLRAHDVPMSLVAPIVEELGILKKPKSSYSGGSYELQELRESRKRK